MKVIKIIKPKGGTLCLITHTSYYNITPYLCDLISRKYKSLNTDHHQIVIPSMDMFVPTLLERSFFCGEYDQYTSCKLNKLHNHIRM